MRADTAAAVADGCVPGRRVAEGMDKPMPARPVHGEMERARRQARRLTATGCKEYPVRGEAKEPRPFTGAGRGRTGAAPGVTEKWTAAGQAAHAVHKPKMLGPMGGCPGDQALRFYGLKQFAD